MKKSFLIQAAFAVALCSGVACCNTPAQKVENAEESVKEANKALDDANKEYLADIENFRKKSADKIAENERSITEFNERIAREKQIAKNDYKKKIALLEQQNSDMKKKMDDYKAEGKEKWSAFKAEFSRDMDELGQGFKDLTVKNNK
jgi:uncharacterized phage infection (PIP) family protein YhgE